MGGGKAKGFWFSKGFWISPVQGTCSTLQRCWFAVGGTTSSVLLYVNTAAGKLHDSAHRAGCAIVPRHVLETRCVSSATRQELSINSNISSHPNILESLKSRCRDSMQPTQILCFVSGQCSPQVSPDASDCDGLSDGRRELKHGCHCIP